MARRIEVDPEFGERVRELLGIRGMSFRALAAAVYYSKSQVHDLVTGRKRPTPDLVTRIDNVLGADGELIAMLSAPAMLSADEVQARELARRVESSDVGAERCRGSKQRSTSSPWHTPRFRRTNSFHGCGTILAMSRG